MYNYILLKNVFCQTKTLWNKIARLYNKLSLIVSCAQKTVERINNVIRTKSNFFLHLTNPHEISKIC